MLTSPPRDICRGPKRATTIRYSPTSGGNVVQTTHVILRIWGAPDSAWIKPRDPVVVQRLHGVDLVKLVSGVPRAHGDALIRSQRSIAAVLCQERVEPLGPLLEGQVAMEGRDLDALEGPRGAREMRELFHGVLETRERTAERPGVQRAVAATIAQTGEDAQTRKLQDAHEGVRGDVRVQDGEVAQGGQVREVGEGSVRVAPVEPEGEGCERAGELGGEVAEISS